uniref:Thiol:disulfide interchange protein n=1 Tax=Periphykon beckeri TaxID=2006982 RepID=A0A1Z1M3B5_9FLOR|nr:thiol:disulfide interchange protein [Periphykon beckeri]ARW60331.1 thiol:disulfide interchange protein [Periphykon beckeri]
MTIILSCYDIFDNYYSLFYALQQQAFLYLFNLSNKQSIFLLTFLFFLGLITVITPCFLSVFPLALSYINSRNNSYINLNLFVTGLLTNLISLMLFTNLLNSSFWIYKLPLFSSSILVLVSLDLMEIINISEFNILFNLNHYTLFYKNTLLYSYCMGFIVGSSSLPCNTSILIIVTFLLRNLVARYQFFICLIVYFIGCLVPLILLFKMKFSYINISIVFFIRKSILPLTGSVLFIFSCFSFLKVIFM